MLGEVFEWNNSFARTLHRLLAAYPPLRLEPLICPRSSEARRIIYCTGGQIAEEVGSTSGPVESFLCPQLPIQHPVINRLTQMLRLDRLAIVQVGNRPGHAQDLVVRPSR